MLYLHCERFPELDTEQSCKSLQHNFAIELQFQDCKKISILTSLGDEPNSFPSRSLRRSKCRIKTNQHPRNPDPAPIMILSMKEIEK
jgi:hypothetical protein